MPASLNKLIIGMGLFEIIISSVNKSHEVLFLSYLVIKYIIYTIEPTSLISALSRIFTFDE